MEALTVIFTGLMIFGAKGQVHIVPAAGHTILVTVVGGKEYPVTKTLTLDGFAGDSPIETVGFEPPSLRPVFTTKPGGGPISLDPTQVLTVGLKGGKTGPYEAYARCDVQGKPALFWQGVKWEVPVPKDAEIMIDKGLATQARVAVTDGMVVRISNEYAGAEPSIAAAAHMLMYEKALKERGKVDFHAPDSCEIFPKIADVKKTNPETKKNNPVTCPPASLR